MTVNELQRRNLGIDEGNGVVKSHEREFIIQDEGGETASYNALIASADCPATATIFGKVLQRVDVDMRDGDLDDWFYATVTYEQSDRERDEPKDRPEGFQEFSFDFQRPRDIIYTSVGGAAGQTVFPAGAVNHGGNVNIQDGLPQGITYDGVGLGITVNRVFPNAFVDAAYQKLVRGLLGKRNNAAFLGYDAKELLLDSARGSIQNNQQRSWDVTFGFSIGEAINGAVAGIAAVTADPHDYIESVARKDAAGDLAVIAVVVSQLFEDDDMSVLGI